MAKFHEYASGDGHFLRLRGRNGGVITLQLMPLGAELLTQVGYEPGDWLPDESAWLLYRNGQAYTHGGHETNR